MAIGEVYSLLECRASPMQDPEAFYHEACDFVKNSIHANENVGLAVSGGIDSTVAARILRDSIGENLYLIHMDHGFMRLIDEREESEIVVGSFSGYPKLTYRNDVRSRFYNAVADINDGDKKRAAFRGIYKDVLDETMTYQHCVCTADGTIKPDIRETRGGIKLQHNVDLGFAQKKLEPLAALSKQEVRALAKYLGIPHLRQPFPGPGLLIRTVGVYSPEKLAVEKNANDIVEQEYRKFMMEQYDREMLIDGETGMQVPFQTFAATFDYDMGGLTLYGSVYVKPLNQVRGAFLKTRVTSLVDDGERYERVYKEPFVVIPEGVEGLLSGFHRHCRGDVVRQTMDATGSSRVLYEIRERHFGDFAVAIRAVDSIDVRTAKTSLLSGVPERAAERILKEVPNVKSVLFDVTPKPPATIEYE